jgi:hypothetical protein
MEESEKKSKSGKQRRKNIGLLLSKIDNFKDNHIWSLWNVVYKTLRFEQCIYKLKEV